MAFVHFIAQMTSMFPHWQGESIYGDLRQIEAHMDETAYDLLHEISREIAEIRRKIEEL
jgi:hypothetical protein